MKKLLSLSLFLFALVALAELPPLIPRDVLLGNPERMQPKISPDGKRLAYIAPDTKNVLQVWVRTVGQNDDQIVTADKKRGIRRYAWAHDGKTLLYAQDNDGDENFHVFGVDVTTKNVRDYTAFVGVRAEIADLNPKFPDQVLVTMNLRDRKAMDVYRVSLKTGAVELDTENPGDVDNWVTDASFQVRGAVGQLPDGSSEVRVRDSAKAPWKVVVKAPFGEELQALDFSLDGKSLFLESSLGSDTTRVVSRDLKSGKETVIAESKKADAGDVFIHPTKHVVQAVSFDAGRAEWTITDKSVEGDFAEIKKLSEGDVHVTSRDDADKTWMVAVIQDKGPVRYYAWDRAAKKGTFLFVHQPKLEGLPLAEMKPVEIQTRDGLTMVSYLTVPVGVAAKNLPMVLLPHGGPWYRDQWGFDPLAQLLANRGYAVLQPNFRGSTGFGKSFLNAGNREWGKKMHDDLIDAEQWAVKQGVADAKKICIMGGSYGGYSALAGAAFTPDAFRCSVDMVGPSNIFTLAKTIPPYWAPFLGQMKKRIGDWEDPKDQQMLRDASPLFSAEKIKIPLLIGQGANDPRVKVAESEQIVAAMEKNGQPVTYVLYPDEGHGFARPENRTDFFARAELFLAQNLGGRAEPLPGDKIAGSTAQVKVVAGKNVASAAQPAAKVAAPAKP